VGIVEYGVINARRLPSGKEIEPADWALAHTIKEGVTIKDELLEIDAFDGKKKIILNYTAPILDENGTIEGAIIVNNEITEQKNAESKMQAIATQWQETFNSVKEAIWIADETGTIVRCNKATEHILGLNEKEIINKKCWSLLHHTENFIDGCPLVCLQTSHKREVFEMNEKNRWFDVTVDPIFNDKGQLTGIVHTLNDITKRKKAEAAIAESEKRYRTLIEAFFDMVYITDYDFKLLFANSALQFQTGYTVEDFNNSGNKISFVFPDDISKVEAFINHFKVSEKKYSTILESRFINSNGKICWHSTIITKVNFSGQLALQFICRDITEQKNYEAALEESEKKYRRLHETMTDCFVETDMEGKIINFNNSYMDMIGYNAEELYNLTYQDITPSKWHAMEQEIVEKQILPYGFSEIYVKEYIKKDGTVFPVELRTFLLRDAENVSAGMWAIIRDVSIRIKSEENIKMLNESLEQRVKVRTAQLEAAYNEMEAFAYSVSHDLRAPLRSIDSFSKILLTDFEDLDPEAIRLLNIISQSSRNMGRLIEDLLSYLKVGRTELNLSTIKMNELVQLILKQLNKFTLTNNYNINIEDLINVPIDKVLLQQVWNNLISNAIKFTSKSLHPEIHIGSYSGNNEVVYFIRDNGVGFDKNYINRLFGVFQRLHSADEFEGTGIGLAIVRKAVIMHGGRVWAESDEGKGATFYFTLPISSG